MPADANACRRGRARGTIGTSPHFPERRGTACTSGLATPPPVGCGAAHPNPRRLYWQRIFPCPARAEAQGDLAETESDGGLEPRFDGLVANADEAVELLLVEVLVEDSAGQIDVTVGPDREARVVRLVVVAAQQPAVKLEVVLRRVGHEVDLEAERARP